jgi:hypothetical protein
LALAELGYKDEVLEYFSKYQTAEGHNLGKKIALMITEIGKEGAFYNDATDHISKEIGYRSKAFFDYPDRDFSSFAVEDRASEIVLGLIPTPTISAVVNKKLVSKQKEQEV